MLKNLKKVISTIAAVALLATSASAFAVTFPDVDESASYAGAVDLLTAIGVVNGDDNGKFNPDNTVTRAEFAKMVVEALGQGDAASKSSYTRFADAQGHWAAGYIEAGVAAEFINGYDENTFGPDDTVTYAQAVKMLVGAAGYESWAQQAGGWTAGYMSYGSSLGITTGVTGVTNDTALTRAQCAVLIANAVKAPLLVTDGYSFVGTMNGVVQVPNYVQKNDKGEGWQSMLTEYHNAYDVKGRVMNTYKQGACKKDEVMFQVEDAKNFDDKYVSNGSTAEAVKFGTTNAADMLFEYAAAVLVKDEDTNEFTIAYIEPYGATKTLEVDAKDVTSIDANYAKVLKSEMTTDTKDYDLNGAVVYVNGYKLGNAASVSVANYIGDNNKFGTVTLVDQSNNASTATDGKYEAIMITKTVSEMVGYTESRSKTNVITLDSGNTFSYDPEDEDTTVTFMMDGEEIAFEDIQEDDVLTITYDIANVADLKNIENASVVVTRNTVTGTVTRTSTDSIVVDGAEYDIAAGVTAATSKEYTFYLDANGVIVASDVVDSNVNYGVVIKRWVNAEGDLMIRLVKADGTVVSYEAKDEDVFKTQLGTSWDYSNFFSGSNIDMAAVKKAVVAYKLSNGKIKEGDAVAIQTNTDLTFKANTSKLGGYKLDESATKILDLSAYLADEEDDAAAMTIDMFEDDVDYKAVVVDKNTSNSYNFVVVVDGVSNVRATSALAIVKKNVGTTEVDEENVTEYTVLKNGKEEVLYTTATGLVEGQIIMYPVTSKAWVADTSIKTVFTPEDSYEAMMNKVLAGTLTTSHITDVSAEVVPYVGVAYKADLNALELITSFTSSKSYTKDNEDLTITGANVYTYDFTKKADKGYRVEAAASSSAAAKFKSISDDAENEITWTNAKANEVAAPIVIVREVENDVTDVFYFVGEWN